MHLLVRTQTLIRVGTQARNLKGVWFLLMHVQEYIRSAQCGGLIPVDEQEEPKLTVNSFAKLVPDGTYTLSQISKEAFARVLGETRHLQQSREDEFGRALTDYAQQTEPDQVRVLERC